MTYQELDYYFPMVVLLYGALITFVINHPKLVKLAEERLPVESLKQMMAHRTLALVCLFVGGLWTLQNIWS